MNLWRVPNRHLLSFPTHTTSLFSPQTPLQRFYSTKKKKPKLSPEKTSSLKKLDPRDFELESKVFSLFDQTLTASYNNSLSDIHPKDTESRNAAEESKYRIMNRLNEIRIRDPDRFDKIYKIFVRNNPEDIFSKEEEAKENREKPLLEPGMSGLGAIQDILAMTSIPEEERDYEYEFKNLKREQYEELYDKEYDFHTESIQKQLENKEDMEDLIYTLNPYDVVTQDYDHEKLVKYYFESVNRKFSEEEEVSDVKRKSCRNRCLFCSPQSHLYPLEPMNIPLLTQFMSTSGSILPRRVNGLCKKMQSRITRTIKYSRTLGLFSYKHGTFTIRNPSYVEDERRPNEDENSYTEDGIKYNDEPGEYVEESTVESSDNSRNKEAEEGDTVSKDMGDDELSEMSDVGLDYIKK